MNGAFAAGDWIVYEENDDSGAHWSIRAVNVVSGEDRLIDSYVQENDQFHLTYDNAFAADGDSIVWATTERVANPYRGVLHAYNLATGATQILQTAPGDHRYEGLLLHGMTLFYTLVDVSGTSNGTSVPYLWDLSQSSPQQVSAFNWVVDDFNAHYFIWGDSQAMTLNIYDRDANQEHAAITENCIRPAISQDRPYVVCLDFNNQQFQLVHLPSGAATPFAINQGDSGQFGEIFNDRVFWLIFQKGVFTSNEVGYFDLPQS